MSQATEPSLIHRMAPLQAIIWTKAGIFFILTFKNKLQSKGIQFSFINIILQKSSENVGHSDLASMC